ncbi:462_t:CDS:2, partial [Funneliformis caledonium]
MPAKQGVGCRFTSSFIYSKSKECALFFQTVNENGCSIRIYKENQLSEEFHELDFNSVWKKIDILKEWSGVTLFGLDNSSVKEKLEQARKLLCFHNEWHNYSKMKQLFKYHLRKRTYSQVNWEIRAWHTMLCATGYVNITPFDKEKSE